MTEQEGTSGDKNPVEQAVEAFVYAPIGLLFDGASLLPQLVEKGRNQVTMARMIGRFAVQQGKGEVGKVAGRVQDQASALLDLIGNSLAPVPDAARDRRTTPAHGGPEAGTVDEPGDASGGPHRQKVATRSRTASASTPASAGGAAGDASALAIPDYDGLSASHVVNRLAGLSSDELEAVRAYETANRGRKTILSKVAQLQSG